MTIKEFKAAYPNGTFELEFTPDALSLKISQGRVGFNLKLFELIVREPGKPLTDSVKEAEECLLAKAFDALDAAETSESSASAEKPERKMRTRKSIPAAHKSAEAPSWTKAEQLMFGFPADGDECLESDDSESIETPVEAIRKEPVEVTPEELNEAPAKVLEEKPEATAETPVEEQPAEIEEQPAEAKAVPAEAPARNSDLAAFAKLSEEEKVDAAARYVLTFGRYKGQTLGEVMGNDIGFAKWLAFKCDRPEVKVYARTLLMAAQKQSA